MEKFSFEPAKKQDVDAKTQKGVPQVKVEDSGAIKDVDEAIRRSVAEGASDIHLEPLAENLLIRMRVKNELVEVKQVSENLKFNVINRIKILAGMDITKNKIPQSGYFRVAVDGKKIELYAYIWPTIYGEKIVIKLQYKQGVTQELSKIGLSQKELQNYLLILRRGSGMVLVVGPPGSGKRTTIYSSIKEIIKPDKLVVAWDPVLKYEIPGMIQGKPEDKSDFSFAEGISAMMKHDPDIAYIGEIQTLEDAKAIIQGSFAKRRVFVRMTANDTVNALQSFVDLGIQPFLVSAAASCVLAQRLIRRLCPKCRQPYPVTPELEKQLGMKFPPNSNFFKTGACEECENTGYKANIAIFEILIPSENFNKAFLARESIHNLRDIAVSEGMKRLKVDGLQKVMAGLTTVEEVLSNI